MENGVVLVQNEVQYHLPVFLYDRPEIHMFCKQIGKKSFTLTYELYVQGELRTSGSSTLVGFNSNQKTSIEIPEKMRAALAQLPQK
jgi:acyl-CoA thioesterase FadM